MENKSQGTILIVDDDEQLVQMLQLFLESHGYECLTANGGGQALSRLARQPVDLIITDLSMTWGDGLSLLQSVRRESNVPVLIISGHAREFAAQVRAFENVIMLPKPVETTELFKHVRACCSPEAKAPSHTPPLARIQNNEERFMGGRTALVADDDAGMIRLLKMTLAPLGVDVIEARDAFSALVRIRETPLDLVILDVNMPAGNGLSVCEMLSTDAALSRLPVIILTGETDGSAKQRCLSMGAHFVPKGTEAMNHVKTLVRHILDDSHGQSMKSQFFIG